MRNEKFAENKDIETFQSAKSIIESLPVFAKAQNKEGLPYYLPLAIGGKDEIVQHLLDRGVNKEVAMLATKKLLTEHTKKVSYARGMIELGRRYHIDGTPAQDEKGAITENHLFFARMTLEDHEMRKLDKKAEKAGIAARQAIDAAILESAKGAPSKKSPVGYSAPQNASADSLPKPALKKVEGAQTVIETQPKTPVVTYRKRRFVSPALSSNAAS